MPKREQCEVEFANRVDPDEGALNEPPHLGLHCLLSSLCIFPTTLYGENRFLIFCRHKFCPLLFGILRIVRMDVLEFPMQSVLLMNG